MTDTSPSRLRGGSQGQHSSRQHRRSGRSLRVAVGGLALALIAGVDLLPGQNRQNPNRGQGPGPQGTARERMWYAPTAEDWQKPVPIRWQRTWDDALAVARETRKPILVCINMDGEIASEHYAGVRYRMPEIAKLYEPYVCVIASVYRHNERDHDENGQRIECPRFGGVTCGEHIAIEPILYEQFLDGERVSPRHIMVEVLDGEPKEVYDVYYAMDTDSVFDLIGEGIAAREIQPREVDRGDLSIVDLVTSRNSEDRDKVEKAYLQADAATQKAMLEQALALGTEVPIDLVRLAIFGTDPELATLARRALAQSDRRESLWLINEALRTPMPAAEREMMLAALERLGGQFKHARTLAVVQRGLRASEGARITGGKYPAPEVAEFSELASAVEAREDTAKQRPDDPESKLALAEASLRMAVDPKTQQTFTVRQAGKYQRLMFEDARRAARQAADLGASGWRVDSVLALCAYYLGEIDEAYRRAESAVAAMPDDAEGYSAIGTIALFGQRRLQQVRAAMRKGEAWESQWLADVHSAFRVLADHPLGTEEQILAHFDLLADLRAGRRATAVLERGLKRFPDSVELHARQRYRWSFLKGVRGMERAYYQQAERPEEFGKNIGYFAGLASLDLAEAMRKRSRLDESRAAYDRAFAKFRAHADADAASRDACEFCLALVLAGRARVGYEQGDFGAAVEDLVAAYALRPDLAAARDGLNLSSVDTAKALVVKMEAAGDRAETLAKLRAAMDQLPPEAFEMPAFERPAAGRGINIPGRLRGGSGGRNRSSPPDRQPSQDKPGQGAGTGAGQGSGGGSARRGADR